MIVCETESNRFLLLITRGQLDSPLVFQLLLTRKVNEITFARMRKCTSITESVKLPFSKSIERLRPSASQQKSKERSDPRAYLNNLSNCLLQTPKNLTWFSTGFEPMTSALLVQCFAN